MKTKIVNNNLKIYSITKFVFNNNYKLNFYASSMKKHHTLLEMVS